MLDFDAARRTILESVVRLESERIPLSLARNRVLAEDIVAQSPLPAFDYSAMDGYAVRAADVPDTLPCELPVAGECRAGGAPSRLPPGAALRIFTGAVLPDGADSIVLQENTERVEQGVRLLERPLASEHIRRRGDDLAMGALALAQGTRLGAFQLGLAAALDQADVCVVRRPRLCVVASGDELRAPGSPGGEGTIPESNALVVAALAEYAGAEARIGPRIPDELGTATRLLSELIGQSDVLVTIGGVSVGDHDVMRHALRDAGARIDFWKVAIKPGKPFVFGRAGSGYLLGLPGNPVSAQITFALFGLPLLRALAGELRPVRSTTRVALAHAFQQKPGRLGVYRGRLDGTRVHLDGNQASGATTSLARADCLVFVPKETSECAPGTELEALRLSEL